jgi:hypothetical protein
MRNLGLIYHGVAPGASTVNGFRFTMGQLTGYSEMVYAADFFPLHLNRVNKKSG